MLDKVTAKTVCELLRGFEEEYKIEEDSQIFFTLDASEEFPHKLNVRIMITEEYMKIYAFPDDFNISVGDSADYMLAINDYNSWDVYIKGALVIFKEINVITIKVESIFKFSAPISVDYLWKDCILFSLMGIRDFYDSLETHKKKVLE